MAVYALVDAAGVIVARRSFASSPPTFPDPEKRRKWFIDEKPAAAPWQAVGLVVPVDLSAAALNYELVDRAIEDLRAEKHAAITARRDELIAAGVTVELGEARFVVQTRDEADLRNVAGLGNVATAMKQLGAPGTLTFRDAGNVDRTLSYDDAQAMALQVAARVSAIYRASWAHKDALEALATAEAVWRYDIGEGWP